MLLPQIRDSLESIEAFPDQVENKDEHHVWAFEKSLQPLD
jgi:hypothetical protein